MKQTTGPVNPPTNEEPPFDADNQPGLFDVDNFQPDTMPAGIPGDMDDLANSVGSEMPISGLAIYSDQLNIAMEDINIPRLNITQGLSKAVTEGFAHVGQVYVAGYEPLDVATVIPLRMARRRELRGDEDQNRMVMCSSNDGEIGYGDIGQGEAQRACKTCPMNQWKEGAKGKRIPPQCTFMYSYLMYIVELDVTAVYDFRRTSIGVGKALNTMAMLKGLGKFAVTFKGLSQKGNNGAYFIPSIQPAAITPEMLVKAKASGF